MYKNISISILRRIGRLLLHPAVERRIAARHAENSAYPAARRRTARWVRSPAATSRRWRWRKWLTHLPRVLVLSEPTRGMDVGAKEDVVHIVRGLREQGIGIVVVSTEPETVLSLADRILVMKKGRDRARIRRRSDQQGPPAGGGLRERDMADDTMSGKATRPAAVDF